MGNARPSYCLIQLKNSAPEDLRRACKEIVAVQGVVAVSAVTGLFDLVAKIDSDESGKASAVSEIRSREFIEFAAPMEVHQVYVSDAGLFATDTEMAKPE
jgi:hypothetical protein